MHWLHLCFLWITAFGLCGCNDWTVREYPTRADAEADKLFERGWLPSLIPLSSHDIRVESELDVNAAAGNFSFDSTERVRFTGALRKMQISEIRESDQFRYLERGYWPFEHRSKSTRWIFFVHEDKGHCEFRMADESSNFR